MAKLIKEVMDIFNDPNSFKVLATTGSVSEINVVPKGSLRSINESLIAFADIFGDKTNRNLATNKKVAVLAVRMEPLAGYQVKGTFKGFQNSGELFDKFAREVKDRIKLDIKAVGTIVVDEVYDVAPPHPGEKIV